MARSDGGGRQGAPAPQQDVVRAERGLSQSKKKPKPTGAVEEAAENRVPARHRETEGAEG